MKKTPPQPDWRLIDVRTNKRYDPLCFLVLIWEVPMDQVVQMLHKRAKKIWQTTGPHLPNRIYGARINADGDAI
jgi:hypothetical protein